MFYFVDRIITYYIDLYRFIYCTPSFIPSSPTPTLLPAPSVYSGLPAKVWRSSSSFQEKTGQRFIHHLLIVAGTLPNYSVKHLFVLPLSTGLFLILFNFLSIVILQFSNCMGKDSIILREKCLICNPLVELKVNTMIDRKLCMSLTFSNLIVSKLLSSNRHMHNFIVYFTRIHDICKKFAGNRVNEHGNVPRCEVILAFSDLEVIALSLTVLHYGEYPKDKERWSMVVRADSKPTPSQLRAGKQFKNAQKRP